MPYLKNFLYFSITILVMTLDTFAQLQPWNSVLTQGMQTTGLSQTAVNVSVDPAAYRLGPGDILEIRTAVQSTLRYDGEVNESLLLIMPEFGVLPVKGATLAQVKAQIAEFLLKINPSHGVVQVSLAHVKTAIVSISGTGVKPGSYQFPGTLRLLDALMAAWEGVMPPLASFNSRSVLVSSPDTSYTVDLLRFLSSGDLGGNPYLFPGENIRIEARGRVARIEGEINGTLTGLVPIRDGENVRSFLSLYRFSPWADTTAVLFGRAGIKPATYAVSALADTLLDDNDFISIPSRMRPSPIGAIRVEGEVCFPGVFPYKHGKTIPRELLIQAGGPSEKADTSRMYVIRRVAADIVDDKKLEMGLSGMRPEVASGARHLVYSGDYSVIPLDGRTVQLEDGDRLVVPCVNHSVYVSGAVKHPGAYPWTAGKNTGWYIRKSSGFTSYADRWNVRVLTVYGTAWHTTGRREPLSGDIIMVPDRVEDKVVKRWIPIIQVLASAASLIAAFIAIGKKD